MPLPALILDMSDPTRVPAGVPSGGQFAATQHAEADIALDAEQSADLPPHGHDHPWNADEARRFGLEVELAGQLAATEWGRSDSRQLAWRIYSGVAMYRGLPVEEYADGSPAALEATERGDDALWAYDQEHPSATPEQRARAAYHAVLGVVEDQQHRRYKPTVFTSRRPADADLALDDGELPPTKHDVAAAKAYLDSLAPVRPMYRGDWERINGGRGPTVAQHRAHMADVGSSRSERARAQAEYDRLRTAWEASDKTQDDDAIHCGNCGFWYGMYEGRCPECGCS